MIATAPKDFSFKLGITDDLVTKSLKDLQAWWERTAPGARKVSLNFLNYYKDPTDPRTFEECTKDAEEMILGDPPWPSLYILPLTSY